MKVDRLLNVFIGAFLLIALEHFKLDIINLTGLFFLGGSISYFLVNKRYPANSINYTATLRFDQFITLFGSYLLGVGIAYECNHSLALTIPMVMIAVTIFLTRIKNSWD